MSTHSLLYYITLYLNASACAKLVCMFMLLHLLSLYRLCLAQHGIQVLVHGLEQLVGREAVWEGQNEAARVVA
jgi:hypothetical protein